MNEVLYTFAPAHSEDKFTFGLSLGITLISLVGLIYLLKQKNTGYAYRRQMMIAMLVFFSLIISAGIAFFSFWSMEKIGDVLVYENSIQTPYGKADFKNISKAYIEVNTQKPVISGGKSGRSTRMLFIEESSGKMHVLSEDNYKIDKILNKMRDLSKKK